MSDRSSVTRRAFIRLSALVAAPTLAAACGDDASPSASPDAGPGADVEGDAGTSEFDADVVVVGAGLSGMMAARTLAAGGVERVVVLEARDRLGGRAYNQEIAPGVPVEAGGQWVGPTQTRILELAEELGVDTFPTHLEGDARVDLGGFVVDVDDLSPTEGPLSQRLDALAAAVSVDEPWNAPMATEWDAMTVAEWFAEQDDLSEEDFGTLEAALGTTLSTTPDQVSFLFFLFYIQSAGGFLLLDSFEGGAQDSRVVGGTQFLATRMAEELPAGYELRLSSPVEALTYDDASVTLATGEGSIRARRAILALGPGIANRIAFTPALSEARQALQAGWPRTTGYKAHLRYATPFWREDGYSGAAIGFGVAGFVMDNSPPDASVGVLIVFAEPEQLPDTAEERAATLAEALVEAFGDECRNYEAFTEYDWAQDEWTTGPVSPLPVNFLTSFGPHLRPPIGPIYWAGTETALVWTGYFEGAVRAGERAANAVVETLA